MNKKMKAIHKAMQDKFAQARKAQDEGRSEDAAKLMDECDALQKDFDLEKRLYERERALVPDEPEGTDLSDPDSKKEISGFAIIAKLLRSQPLSEEERAAITVEPELKALVTGTNATNGEANLIPEDVDTTIRELRRSYISAKDLVTVIPTSSLSGSFDFESGSVTGLKDFDDGDDVPDGTGPTFKAVKFAIALKGMIIPVSNILTAVEKAGLIAYLNNWFVKNAIYSENKDIFDTLKASKSAKELASLDALGESINLDLDPACLVGGVLVTNQTGWNVLDKAKDANGRPMLQPDPANATRKLFKNLPVHVFSDAQLPNDSTAGTKAPVFYGDLKSGCYFVEFAYQFFDASAHAGFVKNRTLMRVIEGYDVIQADADAYCYGLLDPAEANMPTVTVTVDGEVTTKAAAAG